MRSTLVTDTSVVYAALDPDDRGYERCCALLVSGPTLALPAPVVTETCMLARSRGTFAGPDELLGSVLDGSVVVVDLEWIDYARARQLVAQYANLGLSFVDASVVAIAERLQEDTIATLDRRHFSVIRPAHVEAFTLVP